MRGNDLLTPELALKSEKPPSLGCEGHPDGQSAAAFQGASCSGRLPGVWATFGSGD